MEKFAEVIKALRLKEALGEFVGGFNGDLSVGASSVR